MIVFCHVAKTGGCSLNQVFAISYPDESVLAGNTFFTDFSGEKLKEFHHHFDVDKIKVFSAHHIIPSIVKKNIPEARVIIFLRNPIERAFSLYYFLRRTWNVYYKDNLRKPEKYPVDFTKDFRTFLHSYCKMKDQKKKSAPDDFPHLSGDKQVAELDQCYFVGITERFEDSLILLQLKMGLHFKYAHNMRVNDNPDAPDNKLYSESCSPEELKLASELLQPEMQGYKHALKIFEKDFAERDKDLFKYHKTRIEVREKFNETQLCSFKTGWKMLNKFPKKRKIFYGAGKFATALIDAIVFGSLPFPDMILDDAPAMDKVYNVPVRKFSEEKLSKDDIVIVTSDIPENISKITKKLKKKDKNLNLILPHELISSV